MKYTDDLLNLLYTIAKRVWTIRICCHWQTLSLLFVVNCSSINRLGSRNGFSYAIFGGKKLPSPRNFWQIGKNRFILRSVSQ